MITVCFLNHVIAQFFFFFKLSQLVFIFNHLCLYSVQLVLKILCDISQFVQFFILNDHCFFQLLGTLPELIEFFLLLNLIFSMQPHSSCLVSLYPISTDQYSAASCILFDTVLSQVITHTITTLYNTIPCLIQIECVSLKLHIIEVIVVLCVWWCKR